MKHIPRIVFLLLLALAACGSPAAPNPDAKHAVRVDGRYYLFFRDEALLPQDGGQLLGAEQTRVVRRVSGCAGVWVRTGGGVQDPCGLQDGESSLLPAGTALHEVPPFHPGLTLGAVLDGRYLVFNAYFPPD
jgi:hypothetical protein